MQYICTNTEDGGRYGRDTARASWADSVYFHVKKNNIVNLSSATCINLAISTVVNGVELDSQVTDDTLKPGQQKRQRQPVDGEIVGAGQGDGGAGGKDGGMSTSIAMSLEGRWYRFAIAICTGASGIRCVQ